MKRLSDEIVELKQHLERYDKIQELTQMLQESHRCRPGGRGWGQGRPQRHGGCGGGRQAGSCEARVRAGERRPAWFLSVLPFLPAVRWLVRRELGA